MTDVFVYSFNAVAPIIGLIPVGWFARRAGQRGRELTTLFQEAREMRRELAAGVLMRLMGAM